MPSAPCSSTRRPRACSATAARGSPAWPRSSGGRRLVGRDVEAVVREHAEAIGAKLGQVAQPLRAALTGRATSPGLFDVMAVLGKEETSPRLRDQLKDAPAA